MMLDGTMRKPKGVALVQADCPGRTVADYEEAFRGEIVQVADPAARKFIDVRLAGDVAVVTLTRPDSLNALSEELLSQFAAVVREAGALGTIGGRTVKAIVLTGAGRSFVAGADVKEFHGKTADVVDALAWKNISVFTEPKTWPSPSWPWSTASRWGRQRTRDERALPDRDRERPPRAARGEAGIIPGYGGCSVSPPDRTFESGGNLRQQGTGGREHGGVARVGRRIRPVFLRTEASGRRRARLRRWKAPCVSPGLGRTGRRGEGGTCAPLRPSGIAGHPRSPDPGKGNRGKFARARLAAARDALLAMKHGFERGFKEGLRNDARMFGAVAASPGGQEWVGRFLAKDAAQSSFLTILPQAESGEGRRPPRSRRRLPETAPSRSWRLGDRHNPQGKR